MRRKVVLPGPIGKVTGRWNPTTLPCPALVRVLLENLLFFVLHTLHAFQWRTSTQPCVHELIEITVHHCLDVARFGAGAKILHHAIRLKDVAADLVSPRDRSLLAVESLHLGFLFV